jgi:nitroimidazol reductase NimA-like FMN-containing flavoprotein (pyridoxamine 5'-phosphate oxidase superfamily)/GNAT superfamily N-acetyltransferase
MRKEIYRLDEAATRQFLARAPVVHLATTTEDGQPLLRALHSVLLPAGLYFHGAPAGEKMEAIGRQAVVCAETVLAEIPSYFLDPERACPATTYYESVQVHGPLRQVDDDAEKAAALQALMQKYQPEGGHTPIRADDPLYKKAVAGVLVLRLDIEHIDGKAKLGQNRSPDELRRVLTQLWRRGGPDDPRAIDRVVAPLAQRHGRAALPDFLRGPGDTLLCCALGEADADAAVALLADAYWNTWPTRQQMRQAHLGSTAWVGARDPDGQLVATARALSDGGKFALIYDVMVAAAWRGHGLGEAVVGLLLQHPRLRHAARVWLRTRDAMDFYRRYGFVSTAELPPLPYSSTDMWLIRGGQPG